MLTDRGRWRGAVFERETVGTTALCTGAKMGFVRTVREKTGSHWGAGGKKVSPCGADLSVRTLAGLLRP